MLRRWLREAGAEADEAHDLVMAANEAWQNALEHGTGFARTTVGVDLEVDGEHGDDHACATPGRARARRRRTPTAAAASS